MFGISFLTALRAVNPVKLGISSSISFVNLLKSDFVKHLYLMSFIFASQSVIFFFFLLNH